MYKQTRQAQRGVTLIITLIAVVLLTIAGIATFKALDSGATLIGNINMRHTSVQAGDIGIEDARTWLATQSADMDADLSGTHLQLFWTKPSAAQNLVGSAATGAAYFATWGDFDPVTHDWTTSSSTVAALPASLSGFTVQWVVHRMCEKAAGVNGVATAYSGVPTDAATNCIRVSASGTGDSKVIQPQARAPNNSEHPYYRITVKVQAAFRSVTYVQAVTY